MLGILFAIVSQAPAIASITPYCRSLNEVVITGDNLNTVSTARVFSEMDSRLSSVTTANQVAVINDALDAGPSVDFASVGVNLPYTRVPGFESRMGRFTASLEGASIPRTIPLRVTNPSGSSSTVVINKPQLWAVLGSYNNVLYNGNMYAVIGRNMASITRGMSGSNQQLAICLRRTLTISSVTNPNGAVLVVTTSSAHGLSNGTPVRIYGVTGHAIAGVNGTWAITSTGPNTFSLDTSVGNGGATGTGGQASACYLCPVTIPGGINNTQSFSTISNHQSYFRVPSTVPAGSYKLHTFNNENVWGVSNGIDVTVAARDLWTQAYDDTSGFVNISLEDSDVISTVSNPNDSAVVVTTSSPHCLRDGQQVRIAGVKGHALSVNGVWRIGIVSSTEFKLMVDADNDFTGNGGATGTGGSFAAMYRSGDDITHRLQTLIMSSSEVASSTLKIKIGIPAGTFYLSHTIVMPSNVEIHGAGKDQTILMPNPRLTGFSGDTFTAGTFSTNLNSYDDSAGNFSGYGTRVNSGFFSGLKQNQLNPCMVFVGADDCRIAGMTISATHNPHVYMVRDVVSAPNGIDGVVLEDVRLKNDYVSLQADDGTGLEPAGAFFVQNHSDWTFRDCHFLASRCITAAQGGLSTQASNGVNERFWIERCKFEGPYSSANASSAGPISKNYLVTCNEFCRLNRAMISHPGSCALKSVVSFNYCTHMGHDYGGAECFSYEMRHIKKFTVVSATSSTVVVAGDSFDFTGRIVAVLNGKGLGQYRRVASSSYSAPNNTLTLEESWSVTPDTNSIVGVDGMVCDMTFYGNTLESVKGGILLYGSSAGILIEGNTFVTSREGVTADLLHAEGHTPIYQAWCGWLSVENNYFINSNALRLQCVRSATQAATDTWPMSLACGFFGNEVERFSPVVVSTGEGMTTRAATERGTTLGTTPLVVGFYCKGNVFTQDRGAYEDGPVFARPTIDTPLVIFGRNTADRVFSTNSIDDVSMTTEQNARFFRPWSTALPNVNQTVNDLSRGGGIVAP